MPRILFDLVKQEGMSHTSVVLTGETPDAGDAPVARRDRNRNDIVASDGDDPDMTAALPPRRHVRTSSRWRRAGSVYFYVPRRYYYARPPFPLPFPFGW